MERALIPGVPNGYSLLYFNDLVGFKQAQAAAKADPTKVPNISGIQTPNATTVVFKLTEPTSIGFIQALALPVSSPVPQGYASEVRRGDPVVDLRAASDRHRPVLRLDLQAGQPRSSSAGTRTGTRSSTTGRPI